MSSPYRDPIDATEVVPVPQLLERSAETWPDTLFLIGLDRTLTFTQALDEVQRLAGWLQANGLQKGDRVALWLPNGVDWVVAQLAVSWAGGVLVPINIRLRHDDLAAVIARSGSRFLVISGEQAQLDYVALAKDLVAAGRIETVDTVVVIGGSAPEISRFIPLPRELPDTRPRRADVAFDDPAYLMYTSGTTSEPKGVILTFRSLGNAIKAKLTLSAGDVIAFEYPLAAITGCHNTVLGALYAGAGLIVHDGRDRDAAFEAAYRNRANVFAGHRLSLRAWAEVLSDGSIPPFRQGQVFPIDPSDLWAYERLAIERISGGYGMTETSGGVVISQITVAEGLPARAYGRPAYGAQVRIVAEGKDVPVGQEGEIYVRGPQLMAGYWNDPQATASAIDAEGWLHTGDLGTLNEEGVLTFIERLVDTYKCLGFNVSPGEVEDVIKQITGVRDCTVAGVPDPREGAKGIAFILADEGVHIDPEAVRSFAHERLASFKVPRDVVVVDDFPRTQTGKPQRRVLAARYIENRLQSLEKDS